MEPQFLVEEEQWWSQQSHDNYPWISTMHSSQHVQEQSSHYDTEVGAIKFKTQMQIGKLAVKLPGTLTGTERCHDTHCCTGKTRWWWDQRMTLASKKM